MDENEVGKVSRELKSIPDFSEQKHSIYKIPSCIRELNDKAYKPWVVSFGPYHHGDGELEQMEVHKKRALRKFLERAAAKRFGDSRTSCEDIESTLSSLVESFTTEDVQHLKDSYDALDPKWCAGFLMMMIHDGCFMLEIMRPAQGYSESDPIFSKHGRHHKIPFIKRDMLMLENQIPSLVLKKLLAFEANENAFKGDKEITQLILGFYYSRKSNEEQPQNHSDPHVSGEQSSGHEQAAEECLHVLDAYRKKFIEGRRPCGKRGDDSGHLEADELIKTAKEIVNSGVTFTDGEGIDFRKGVLKLPAMVVDDSTEATYLNMMAFEQQHVGCSNDVTSYIFFMDCLIDDARDVALLEEKGIIQNAFGSDTAVADLFNKLSREATLVPEGELNKVHRSIKKYCNHNLNKYRAYCMNNYFTNPWVSITVIAGIIIFLLTVLQTVYTVRPDLAEERERSHPLPRKLHL